MEVRVEVDESGTSIGALEIISILMSRRGDFLSFLPLLVKVKSETRSRTFPNFPLRVRARDFLDLILVMGSSSKYFVVAVAVLFSSISDFEVDFLLVT